MYNGCVDNTPALFPARSLWLETLPDAFEPAAKARIAVSTSSSERPDSIIAQLKRVSLFSGLNDEHLSQLASHCRRRRFGAGEALFRDGDPGQTMYIVVSGRVNIEKPTADGETVHIAQRGPGEHFGEMALLDDMPRSADAATDCPCDILILDRRELMQCLQSDPEIAWNIIRALSRRLREAAEQTMRSETLDVMGRLAAYLLDATAGVAPDAQGHYHLSRTTEEQMSSRIGAARESVSRKLSRLKQIGAIRREGRTLIVTNPQKLRVLCGK